MNGFYIGIRSEQYVCTQLATIKVVLCVCVFDVCAVCPLHCSLSPHFSLLKWNCFYDCRCYLWCCGLECGYHLLFVIAFLCRLIMSCCLRLCVGFTSYNIHKQMDGERKKRATSTPLNSERGTKKEQLSAQRSYIIQWVACSNSTSNSYGSYRRNMKTSDTHIQIRSIPMYNTIYISTNFCCSVVVCSFIKVPKSTSFTFILCVCVFVFVAMPTTMAGKPQFSTTYKPNKLGNEYQMSSNYSEEKEEKNKKQKLPPRIQHDRMNRQYWLVWCILL